LRWFRKTGNNNIRIYVTYCNVKDGSGHTAGGDIVELSCLSRKLISVRVHLCSYHKLFGTLESWT